MHYNHNPNKRILGIAASLIILLIPNNYYCSPAYNNKVLDILTRNGAITSEEELASIPVWARKMGAKTWNTEPPRTGEPPTNPPTLPEQEEVAQEDYEYDPDDGHTPECEPGSFWHIRGERCVPEWCEYYEKRDPNTGECVGTVNYPFRNGFSGYGGYPRTGAMWRPNLWAHQRNRYHGVRGRVG